MRIFFFSQRGRPIAFSFGLLISLNLLSLLSPSCVSSVAAEDRLEGPLQNGIRLFEQEQWAEARTIFLAAIKTQPENALVHFYLGRIAFQGENYDTAVEWFEKAAELEKDNSTFHLWLGRGYGYQAEQAFVWQQLFLARKVKKQFEKAVALDADNVLARWDLMEYYLKAPRFLGGSWDKAKAEAREIEQRDAAEGKEAWRLIAELEGKS
jgi:tetratricopeptide (TPR) repeat protein